MREHQEQADDEEEEEVKEQESPEEQEVGKHSCPKTSTNSLDG